MVRNTDNQETMAELSRELQEENVKRQETNLNPTAEMRAVHPGQEKLQQALEQLQSIARQQQLQTEQSLQNTLSQASTSLQDARRVDTISKLLTELGRTMESPATAADPQPLLNILEQAEKQVQQQLHQTDMQVAQSLQQAVSALAQSQAAMFDAQNYSQIQQLFQQCRDTLNQQWPKGTGVH